MIDVEKAKQNPASVFQVPDDVVQHTGFSTRQKIEILHRWEYDIREMQVAEEENMPPGGSEQGRTLLTEVLEALHKLGAPMHTERASPTKQGGQ